MPTYDYKCQSCGHGFERFERMSDDPVQTCPACGGRAERLIGAEAGFLFKGAGLHPTDYKSLPASCSREQPCCGRNTSCDRRPCEPD
jgi:putative FmdB family regulatory protein